MGIKLHVFRYQLSLAIICCLFFSAISYGAEKAGFVIVAKGKVIAVGDSGEERRLKRRSPLFEGDKVITKQNSKAQIKLLDGAVMALQPSTIIQFDQFIYQPDKQQEKSIFKLVEGGFRAITGAIGKKNPDDYRVDTPLASIGIRGTHYGVVLGETLSMAVWQGKIKVQNDNGVLNLGPDQPYSYGQVTAPDAAPQGQLEPPVEVNDTFGSELTEEEQEPVDEQGADESGEGSSDEVTNNTEQEQTGTEAGSEAEDVDRNAEQEQTGNAPPPANEDTGDTDMASKDEPAPADQIAPQPGSEPIDEGGLNGDGIAKFGENDPLINDGAGDVYEATGIDALAGDIYPTEPNPTGDLAGTSEQETLIVGTTQEVTGTVDLRLNDAEIGSLDRVGVVVAAGGFGSGEFFSFAGGPASDGASGSPIIVDYGALPESPDFDPTKPFSNTDIAQFVVRKGSAPFNSVSIINPDEIPYGLTAGVWRGDISPATVQVNPFDPTDIELIDTSMFWVTGIPTLSENMAILQGTVRYDQVDFFAGEGSAGGLWDFDITFDVNFNTGAIYNGSIIAKNGINPNNTPFDKWQFSFTGKVEDVRFEFSNPLSGSLTKATGGVVSAEGDLGAFAADPEADFAAGAFRFWQASNPDYFVTGIFGVHTDDDTLGFDNRLSVSEASNIDKAMHMVIDGTKQFGLSEFGKTRDALIHIGKAAALVTGSPVLFSEDLDPFGGVFRQGTAAAGGLNNSSVPFAEWGYWDGTAATPVKVQRDPSNANNVGLIDKRVYWIYGDPTPVASIPTSGSFTYTDAGGALLGSAFDGNLSVGSGLQINVNFAAQTFTGTFNMTSNSANTAWTYNFSGGMDDAELFTNSVSGNANVSGTNYNLDSAIDATLIGTSAGGVIGGFKGEAKTNSAIYSNGVFFLQ